MFVNDRLWTQPDLLYRTAGKYSPDVIMSTSFVNIFTTFVVIFALLMAPYTTRTVQAVSSRPTTAAWLVNKTCY